MNAPRIAVLGLGGTIAMRSEGSGAVPALSAEDLVAALPAAAAKLVGPVENFRQLPGAHLELDDVVALAARIRELSHRGQADGFIVVQGTDTIEETVFALELLLDGEAPVVVTGAMRHAGQVSADGPANVAAALHTAAALDSRGQGALVCFNDEIHAGWAVQKTAATNPAAFSSPGFGPVGHVIENRARFDPSVHVNLLLARRSRQASLLAAKHVAVGNQAKKTAVFGVDHRHMPNPVALHLIDDLAKRAARGNAHCRG